MRRVRERVRAELRQRRHHAAFRIGPPEWDDERRARVERALAELNTGGGLDSLDEHALIEAANKLFQARRKVAQPGENGRPGPEARAAGRYLATVEEELGRAGLTVQDHTGDRFKPGHSLKVLIYEDDPALDHETVVDTVKPSIYLHDRRIQMGVVIVGRPGGPDRPADPADPADPDTNDLRNDDE